MLTCKDTAKAIAHDEGHTGAWRRRLTLWFHSLLRTHGRRYAAQPRAVGASVGLLHTPNPGTV